MRFFVILEELVLPEELRSSNVKLNYYIKKLVQTSGSNYFNHLSAQLNGCSLGGLS